MKSSESEYITIGRILAPWGIEGKLKVEVATDFPQRFASTAEVYINQQTVIIGSAEWHKGKVIIKLDAIDSIEAAEKLCGQLIEIHRSQLYQLPEGQYYHFQLVGMEVWTTQDELLGNITEILTMPSNDSYVVSGAKGEVLIPAIEDVVKVVDLTRGYVLIEPIEGLLNFTKKPSR